MRVINELKSKFDIGEEWAEDPSLPSQKYTFLGRDLVITRTSSGERELQLTQEAYAGKLSQMAYPDVHYRGDEYVGEDAHTLYRATVGRLNWLAYKTRGDLTAAAHFAATKNVRPCWDDVKALNKGVRAAIHHKGIGLRMLKMSGNVRIVALSDASHNKDIQSPSLYGAFFYISDFCDDYDANLFTCNPDTSTIKAEDRWVKASLLFWRLRVVKRRVDTIMDVETLAIQYSSVVVEYLNNMAKEMQLSKTQIKPLIYNDNQGTIDHMKSSNKHNNPRLNVIWATLREAYTNNKFGLRWLCGKTRNTSDILTKLGSCMEALFFRSCHLGKILIPAKQQL